MNEEDDVLVVNGRVREQQKVRHVQNQMTVSFQARKDDTAIRVT